MTPGVLKHSNGSLTPAKLTLIIVGRQNVDGILYNVAAVITQALYH